MKPNVQELRSDAALDVAKLNSLIASFCSNGHSLPSDSQYCSGILRRLDNSWNRIEFSCFSFVAEMQYSSHCISHNAKLRSVQIVDQQQINSQRGGQKPSGPGCAASNVRDRQARKTLESVTLRCFITKQLKKP
jgi:hypothetical protein